MPLVRVSVIRGRPPEVRRRIGDAIHQALIDTIDVPKLDRFQLLTEHDSGDLVYDSSYLGIARSDNIVIVQITLSAGRTLAQKRRLYDAIAGNIAALGVRREDVWINLVEVSRDDWSFGNGVASYAPAAEAAA